MRVEKKKETKLYLKVAEHLQVELYYLFMNLFENSFEMHACIFQIPNSNYCQQMSKTLV